MEEADGAVDLLNDVWAVAAFVDHGDDFGCCADGHISYFAGFIVWFAVFLHWFGLRINLPSRVGSKVFKVKIIFRKLFSVVFFEVDLGFGEFFVDEDFADGVDHWSEAADVCVGFGFDLE